MSEEIPHVQGVGACPVRFPPGQPGMLLPKTAHRLAALRNVLQLLLREAHVWHATKHCDCCRHCATWGKQIQSEGECVTLPINSVFTGAWTC